MNQKEWDRMIGQELYDPFNVHDDSFQRVHAAQRKFNASDDLNKGMNWHKKHWPNRDILS